MLKDPLEVAKNIKTNRRNSIKVEDAAFMPENTKLQRVVLGRAGQEFEAEYDEVANTFYPIFS